MYKNRICGIIALAGRFTWSLRPPLEAEEVVVMTDYEMIMVVLAILGLLIAAFKLGRK